MRPRFQKRHYEAMAGALHGMPAETTKPAIRDAFNQALGKDFQKRHKEAIWGVIDGLDGPEFIQRSELVANLGDMLEYDNPNFSQIMFEEFCETGKYGKRTTGVRRERLAIQREERKRRLESLGLIQSKTVRQSEMTSECWSVQVWGREACDRCEFKGTDECGGQNILATGENEKGVQIPLKEAKE